MKIEVERQIKLYEHIIDAIEDCKISFDRLSVVVNTQVDELPGYKQCNNLWDLKNTLEQQIIMMKQINEIL